MSWQGPDKWDHTIPESPEEVIRLLRRRIEIHARWRDWLRSGDPEALAASESGVGTVESHQVYIDQYEAAIRVIEGLLKS